MNRYTVAFVSALVGVAAAVPYAVLKSRDLPPIAPVAVNGPPCQLSFEEMLFITECCITFYAVTYFVGKRIYSMADRQEDLHAVQQFSGTHMQLLHTFAGGFMIVSPWLGRPPANGNRLATWLSVAIGVAMLASGIGKIISWAKKKSRTSFTPKDSDIAPATVVRAETFPIPPSECKPTNPTADTATVTVIDTFGRQGSIPQERWRQDILPSNLKQHWDDPDALYSMIVMAVNDEFYSDVLQASERLLAIDHNRERGHAICGFVLMKNGNVDGAERLLQSYVQEHGATGSILTMLAKVYAQQGKPEQVEATLWDGLLLDPNQENGLLWWASIHQDRSGEDGFRKAMNKAAAIDHSWRPQLWLARDRLENKDFEGAKQYYDYILKLAGDQPEVLMMISGDLGKNGYVHEILDLVLPFFDPERHGVAAGTNLLSAYLETKNVAEGEQLLHQLFALNRPEMRDRLMFFSTEFDKIKRPGPQPADQPASATAFRFDQPIWAYGLEDPKWLFPSRRIFGKGIAILGLANTSPTELDGPALQPESILGRLTRSIPLYLLESLYYRANMNPTVVLPVYMGKGPLVFGKAWSIEYIRMYAKGIADTALAGAIEQVGESIKLQISIWDCRKAAVAKTFEYITAPELLGRSVLQLEGDLLKYFRASATCSESPRIDVIVRPTAETLDGYLCCLGQAVSQVLVRNNGIPFDAMQGERNIFEQYIATALAMNDAQVPRILLVAALANSRAYGSQIFSEFRRQALALVKDALDSFKDGRVPMNGFYRLSPLLLKTFDMHREFAQCKAEMLQTADRLYRNWIGRL